MFKYRIHEFEIWCFPLSDAGGVKKKSILLLLQFKSLGRNINYPPGYYLFLIKILLPEGVVFNRS